MSLENLYVQKITSASEDMPVVLNLHGGHLEQTKRAEYLMKDLCGQGYAGLMFDHYGFGHSGGALSECSLKRRVDEALYMMDTYLDKSRKHILIGTSMGGHIACELVKRRPDNISHVILFCPALYSKDAYDVPFGESFKRILTKENSYLDENVLQSLSTFSGKLCLVYGDEDKIIPPEIFNVYKALIEEKNGFVMPLSGCPHNIHKWFEDHGMEKERTTEAIKEFLLS